MEEHRNRTGLQAAQVNGSEPSNANELSESLPVHLSGQPLDAERIPIEHEHSVQPVLTNAHNTEAREGLRDEMDRCRCLKIQEDGTVRDEGSYCTDCGMLIEEQSPTTPLQSVWPPLPSGYAFYLPCSLSENSMQDHNSSTSRRPRTRQDNEDPSPVEERGRTLVHGTWRKKTTFQIPSRPRVFEFFLTVDVTLATNEKRFSVQFLPVQRYPDENIKVSEDINLNAAKIIAIGEEGMSLKDNKHFHRISLTKNTKVTITFEILRRDGNIEIMGTQPAKEVPIHRILCTSQERFPGAITRVLIRCLGEPGQRCENHIRMTIKYGENQRAMIFPVWFHVQP
ncbi:uncharacterized protein [Montipora capricornis]|uniref:uncharacterized protein n=1 Tax=Montipora capricornis TaxID=246305 RepID=UPI0035F0FC00